MWIILTFPTKTVVVSTKCKHSIKYSVCISCFHPLYIIWWTRDGKSGRWSRGLFKRCISSIMSLPIKRSNCTGFEMLCFSLHNLWARLHFRGHSLNILLSADKDNVLQKIYTFLAAYSGEGLANTWGQSSPQFRCTKQTILKLWMKLTLACLQYLSYHRDYKQLIWLSLLFQVQCNYNCPVI